MTSILVEIIGWAGAVLVLGAYVAVSMGKLTGSSPAFQWMNALGAAFFVLNTWWHGAIPSMVLNIIWSGIGFFALWRLSHSRRSARLDALRNEDPDSERRQHR